MPQGVAEEVGEAVTGFTKGGTLALVLDPVVD